MSLYWRTAQLHCISSTLHFNWRLGASSGIFLILHGNNVMNSRAILQMQETPNSMRSGSQTTARAVAWHSENVRASSQWFNPPSAAVRRASCYYALLSKPTPGINLCNSLCSCFGFMALSSSVIWEGKAIRLHLTNPWTAPPTNFSGRTCDSTSSSLMPSS